MNTKTFAQQARKILLKGVGDKLRYWDFDARGHAGEGPQAVSGGYIFRGEVYDDPAVPALWQSLSSAVQHKGLAQVAEEAAYTWFNRMMAIRILSKNGYDLAQLEFAPGAGRLPLILQRAQRGTYPFLNTTEKARLQKVIADHSRETEAFAILLIGYCHSHALLQTVFGSIEDYTELLLPDDILAEEGFLNLLNTTDAISDEEYRKVELIGWLYQFYISEKKDEVFAGFKKNKKAEAADIPAATQIFTPNWIVKYMVQNTVGKLWLDLHPDSPLKAGMKYLVESPNPSPNPSSPIPNPLIKEVAQLKLLDPAAGSGHILVEGFDLLYDMYLAEYYSPEEAVESILQNNLFGLDIDKRAAQLAQFALLLKAAARYPGILKKGLRPHIYAMPEPRPFSRQDVLDFLGREGLDYVDSLADALHLMQQAQNLGSIMQFKLPEAAVEYIRKRWQYFQAAQDLNFHEKALLPALSAYLPALLILCNKYGAVVANPPYMGSNNMNGLLREYSSRNYPDSQLDLSNIFVEKCIELTTQRGTVSLINQQTWMFLGSYKKFRINLLNKYIILNLLHLGPKVFKELSGEKVQNAAFSIQKTQQLDHRGIFFNLTPFQSTEKKHRAFLDRQNLFSKLSQKEILSIEDSPIFYDVSQKLFKSFNEWGNIGTLIETREGLTTGDNERFIRYWFEVSRQKLNKKWFYHVKGGPHRKWSGNIVNVINWENDGYEIKNNKTSDGRVRSHNYNEDFIFKEGLSWNTYGSGEIAFRYVPEGCIFDSTGSMGFVQVDDFDINFVISYLNSIFSARCLALIKGSNRIQPGHILKTPIETVFVNESTKIQATKFSKTNIDISDKDWNSHEISWDFQHSPLLNNQPNLRLAYEAWQAAVTQDFFQLHANEEELNRIFIDIYGLQDELTPEVPLKDITILQEELERGEGLGVRDEMVEGYKQYLEKIERDEEARITDFVRLPIRREVVMQQFLSYLIGLCMGRYRLDRPGLHIAHPNPAAEEIALYKVIRGKGLGPREQMAIINFLCDEHKEFSRSHGLAKIHESGHRNIPADGNIPEVGTIRADQPNQESGSIGTIEHRRGTQPGNQGVFTFSEDSQRVAGRTGDPAGNSDAAELPYAEQFSTHSAANHRNLQDAQWLAQQAESLIPYPSSLTPIQIDEDAILPLMGTACEFPDDALQRIKHLLDIIWGADTRTDNLNFLQECLDQDLEKYLVRQFWKDHCRRYKKKPIYWLFSSPGGAFQVLVYMHRMNAFTVERIRDKYLLPHINHLRGQIHLLEGRSALLSAQDARQLDRLRKDAAECEAYELVLKDVADRQITFDLDDGVSRNYKLFEGVVAEIK